MSKKSEVIKEQDVTQAVLIADCFSDEFEPIVNDENPFALISIVNKALIDYSLEFLSLGGIEETFVFCCHNVEQIKQHIDKGRKESVWEYSMTVHVVASETCRSVGDCLRDLDAKALIRKTFVLIEPGVVSNIKLLSLIKKHNDVADKDKGAAMTIICQESGLGQYNRCPTEELVLASNSNTNRVLYYNKIGLSAERNLDFPLEIFLENSTVALNHNLKDVRIAICSPVVLPLFTDNFDFQSKDDFVRGLLMNEEILGSTVYWHMLKGSQHAGAVTNWRMYHTISREIIQNRLYPVQRCIKPTRFPNSVIGENCTIPKSVKLVNVVMGNNVEIGENVTIRDSYIFNDVRIGAECSISNSLLNGHCQLKEGQTILHCKVNNEDLKSGNYDRNCKNDDDGDNDRVQKIIALTRKLEFSTCTLQDCYSHFEDSSSVEEGSSEEDNDADEFADTKLFFMEVFDSLVRGFEEKLQCDNLILEINSSRYAYNITLKEVNYNVVKAILSSQFGRSTTSAYFAALRPCLEFFLPIFKNYIKTPGDMGDCLQAMGEVSRENQEMRDGVAKVLHWFYDKEILVEEAILSWYDKSDANAENTDVISKLKDFVTWLREAEEDSSSDEE